jgi:hypothetical protein
MRLPTRIALLIAAFAILGTAPASAQLYKWVDERGVTNYSNQPPADPGAVKKLGAVEGNLSVYSPDKGLTRAVEEFRRESNNRALAERVDYLERQLEAERQARSHMAAAAPPAPCTDCYADSGYYPAYGGGFFPARHRKFHQAKLPPGAIAGNVVGMSGYIPGQSALAASLAPPRAPRSRPVFDRPLR